jgi:hypothetical protein
MPNTKEGDLTKSRNWALGRIKGLMIPTEGLTEIEKDYVRGIRAIADKLLEDWEENSIRVGQVLERYMVENPKYGAKLYNKHDMKFFKWDNDPENKITKYVIKTIEQLREVKSKEIIRF